MKNQKETIHGVTGTWKTITKTTDVIDGQLVRYDFGAKSGYNGDLRWSPTWKQEDIDICKGKIQAFYPKGMKKPQEPKEPKTVAEFEIYKSGFSPSHDVVARTTINGFNCEKWYETIRSAVRGSKRFCKAIGYEFKTKESK